MRDSANEVIEHCYVPPDVARQLEIAGGCNCFGEPNFKLVWGFNRIIKMHGQWEELEPAVRSRVPIIQGGKIVYPVLPPRVKSAVIETREVPKYLPGNCWHLEKWCAPETYGSPEKWGKLGQEVIGRQTIDTAGPFPSRGEYELVMPITSDGTQDGAPIPLVSDVILNLIGLIKSSANFSYLQRRNAIAQREEKKRKGYRELLYDILKDGQPAFHGMEHTVVPEMKN